MKQLLSRLTPGDGDWMVARRIDPSQIPAHIAVIMDGNGRWARRRNLPRLFGHHAGVRSVRMVTETCAELGVGALTLYAFSIENWKRPAREVEGLLKLLRTYLRRELDTLMTNNIRLTAIGRTESLPGQILTELRFVEERTAANTGMRLNLALNYGGRAELVDAMNAMLAQARSAGMLETLAVSEEMIAAHLYTAGLGDPDLLIRTSGELRVSNFLLWQIAYAEIYVTPTLWPDFTRAELLTAILDYQSRERRFGGIHPERINSPAYARAPASAMPALSLEVTAR